MFIKSIVRSFLNNFNVLTVYLTRNVTINMLCGENLCGVCVKLSKQLTDIQMAIRKQLHCTISLLHRTLPLTHSITTEMILVFQIVYNVDKSGDKIGIKQRDDLLSEESEE